MADTRVTMVAISADVLISEPRKCARCGRELPPGARMLRIGTCLGGTVYDAYMCAACQREVRRAAEGDTLMMWR